MSNSTHQQLCGPGSITRLERALAAIERTSFARAIPLLRNKGLECVVELLLAQDGVALLLRERTLVRRMLHNLHCAEPGCGRFAPHIDNNVSPPRHYCERHTNTYDELVSFSQELVGLDEIESAEDRA